MKSCFVAITVAVAVSHGKVIEFIIALIQKHPKGLRLV
jgi:hypothetical protein